MKKTATFFRYLLFWLCHGHRGGKPKNDSFASPNRWSRGDGRISDDLNVESTVPSSEQEKLLAQIFNYFGEGICSKQEPQTDSSTIPVFVREFLFTPDNNSHMVTIQTEGNIKAKVAVFDAGVAEPEEMLCSSLPDAGYSFEECAAIVEDYATQSMISGAAATWLTKKHYLP